MAHHNQAPVDPLNMTCPNCQQEVNRIMGLAKKTGMVYTCARCGQLPMLTIPDIYFRQPGIEEHLADAKNPEGTFITSKTHKAEVMKQLGLVESGDRFHGSRNESHKGWGERD